MSAAAPMRLTQIDAEPKSTLSAGLPGYGLPAPGTETGMVRISPVRGPSVSRWRLSL